MNTSYAGTDNLEIMSYAQNYNSFLLGLLVENCKKDSNVLDFGAGIGTFAKRLQEIKDLDILCVEPDIKQREILTSLDISALADISAVPDSSVDFIYSLNVIEHIYDDRAIIKALADKLAPGGRLLIYVPAFNLLFSSMDKKVGHYRRYNIDGLRELASSANLKLINGSYADSLGFIVTFVYKLIGNKSGDLSIASMKIYDSFIFPISRVFDKILSNFFGKNVYILVQKN